MGTRCLVPRSPWRTAKPGTGDHATLWGWIHSVKGALLWGWIHSVKGALGDQPQGPGPDGAQPWTRSVEACIRDREVLRQVLQRNHCLGAQRSHCSFLVATSSSFTSAGTVTVMRGWSAWNIAQSCLVKNTQAIGRGSTVQGLQSTGLLV